MTFASVIAEDAPLAWYRLGEYSGTTAVDSGSLGANGVYTGGCTLGVDGLISSDRNRAVALDGSGYVQIGAVPALNLSRSFSVEAWVKHSGSAYAGIISYADAGFYLRFAPDGTLQLLSSATAFIGASASAVSNDVRHQVGFRIAADGAWAIIIDGVVDATGVTSVSLNGTYGLRIGGDRTGSLVEGITAVIDEVAIYGSALSDARWAAHYTAGTTGEPLGDGLDLSALLVNPLPINNALRSTHNGYGRIAGHLTYLGANARKRVMLFARGGCVPQDLVYSRVADGYFEFVNLDPKLEFFVLGFDDTPGTINAEIADHLIPA